MSISPLHTRPVWAEISTAALLSNCGVLRSKLPAHAELLAVVKANAYGHGLDLCAPALAASGVSWFGVTGAEEGQSLRAICKDAHILLMSGVWSGEGDRVIDQGLVPVVWEHTHLDILEQAARRRDLPPASLPVHLEIDSGMSRQGVRIGSAKGAFELLTSLLKRFEPSSPLVLQGVMTHFASPEVIGGERTGLQIAYFQRAMEIIETRGVRPAWIHAGNSSTIAVGHDLQILKDLAEKVGSRLLLRPGLALYGYLDRVTCDGENMPGPPGFLALSDALQAVMSLKARITSLRTLAPGDSVGYNGTFTTKRPTRLALLPIGYADGVNRLLSNRGHVLIQGRRAPIAGRVSMDQTVVDVTDIPLAAIGDEAVLIGTQGSERISAWELADLAGTIPWEVLCAVSARVPRVAAP